MTRAFLQYNGDGCNPTVMIVCNSDSSIYINHTSSNFFMKYVHAFCSGGASTSLKQLEKAFQTPNIENQLDYFIQFAYSKFKQYNF